MCIRDSCFGYGVTLVLTPWNLLWLAGTVIPGRLMLHVAPLAIAAGVAIIYSRRDGIESPSAGAGLAGSFGGDPPPRAYRRHE